MSMMIESTDELLTLLKKMNLKVASVDELRQLLATINANYNPDAARQKTGKLLSTTVPGFMAGAGAFVSFFLVGPGMTPSTVGGLALVWGAVAVVSTAAVIAGAILTNGRRGRTSLEGTPDRKSMFGEELLTGIRKDLP